MQRGVVPSPVSAPASPGETGGGGGAAAATAEGRQVEWRNGAWGVRTYIYLFAAASVRTSLDPSETMLARLRRDAVRLSAPH